MPYIYAQAPKLRGKEKAGNGDCVDLVKSYFPGLKSLSATMCWRPGMNVFENRHLIAPGTAIATFDNGRYSDDGKVSKHAAIFLRADGVNGIVVIDQWKRARSISSRTIRKAPALVKPDANGRWPFASNIAEAFYVIALGSCQRVK